MEWEEEPWQQTLPPQLPPQQLPAPGGDRGHRPPASALGVTLGVLWELPGCPALPKLLNGTLIASMRGQLMKGLDARSDLPGG